MVNSPNAEVNPQNKNHNENYLESIMTSIRAEALKREETLEKKLPDETVKSLNVHTTEHSAYNIIPETFDLYKRALPNVFARSAIFGIVKYNNTNRLELKKEKVFSTKQYEIFFTGEVFDQNDLAVWDAIVYLAKTKKCSKNIHTSLYEICKYIGISNDTKNRTIIMKRIDRLSINAMCDFSNLHS